jgi:hypothetical protein
MLRRVLGTVIPAPADLATFALAVVLPIAIVETQKAIARRRVAREAPVA